MRKIEDLLKFKVNSELQDELESQILFDNRKAKVEEESLLDEYDDDVDTVSWESIEISCWDLMKNKGLNWKIFTIWLEALIYIHGWDEVIYCFNALQSVLQKKLEILLSQEDRVGCLEFMDKAISRALVLQPIYEEDTLFQYLNYKKMNPQKLYESLSHFDLNLYNELLEIYEISIETVINLPKITKEVHLHFSKILDSLTQFYDILNIYEKNFIPEDDDEEDEKNETAADQSLAIKSENNIKNPENKEVAFQAISNALELLQKVDPQNISIPLLRKIMRWQDKNISEIINEINDKEAAYFLLKFLMD